MCKVIVLMSTYNGEKYLCEQINSILVQKGVDVELLIRDDGSSDSTVSILEKYASKYKNVNYYAGKRLKPALSFTELMTCPIEGDFYALSDQDDVWDDDKLLCAIKMLKEEINKGIPMLYFSNLRIVDKNCQYIRNSHSELIRPQKYVALTEDTATGCTIVYNRTASLLMRERKTDYCSMHDAWVYIICVFLGKVVYDSVPHIKYRQHENNVVGTYLKRKSIKLYIKRIKRLLNPNLQPRIKNAKKFRYLYGDILSPRDLEKVNIVANYKKSLGNRLKLLCDKDIHSSSSARDIIFKIQILLGIA